MKIAEIYEQLLNDGKVSSKREFSIIMLGKTWNYYSSMNEDISRDALVHLLVTLRKRGEYGLMEAVMQRLERVVESTEHKALSRHRPSKKVDQVTA